MSKSKHTDLICLIVTAVMLAVTVLFCNGEALGLTPVARQTLLDEGGSYSAVIRLADGHSKVKGSGAYVAGDVVTIAYGGEYTILGSLSNGQIIVETSGRAQVTLVLSGADVTCADGAALWVKNCGLVTVKTAGGTENRFSSGAAFSDEATALGVTGAVYSEDDLTFRGDGSLTVTDLFRHGIVCKDALRFESGTYTVQAADGGVRGRDSVTISGGAYDITAGGDGIKANNNLDEKLGVVTITAGSFTINAGADGIQAETTLRITGGDFSVVTGGGAAASTKHAASGAPVSSGPMEWDGVGAKTAVSCKGLKAGTALEIEGGSFLLDCSDDAVHSNGTITLAGGTLSVATGDDAVHADRELDFRGAKLTVNACYEGLESFQIVFSAGSADIAASDDGVNASAGKKSVNQGLGLPCLTVSGGTLRVRCGGDGLDSNGDIRIEGGTVAISACPSDDAAALDYGGEEGGTCRIAGGTLTACGFSGAAEGFADDSGQASLMVNLTSAVPGGTALSLLDGEGKELLTFTPENEFDSVLLSCPELTVGGAYTLRVGWDEYAVALESVAGVYGGDGGGTQPG